MSSLFVVALQNVRYALNIPSPGRILCADTLSYTLANLS